MYRCHLSIKLIKYPWCVEEYNIKQCLTFKINVDNHKFNFIVGCVDVEYVVSLIYIVNTEYPSLILFPKTKNKIERNSCSYCTEVL